MPRSSPAGPGRGASALLVPTLRKQSALFMVGSALFAVGSAPGLSTVLGPQLGNLAFFIGAWWFTAAGFVQLAMSGPPRGRTADGRVALRSEWAAAAVQSVGTLLFNVSTTAALSATTLLAERHLVWRPDAGGSLAFLVSAGFACAAYRSAHATLWDPRRGEWWSTVVNLAGCVAFAVSAIGAFIESDGDPLSSPAVDWGTCLGAVCFFVASWIVLPRRRAATHRVP